MTRTSAFVTALGALLALAACSGTPEPDAAVAAVAPAADSSSQLVLPAEQQARVKSALVQPVTYKATVSTTGTVAFDGDQSTAVLSPISGPVTRILVEPGAHVRRGQPLAYVSSPDFAAAVADFRKALAQARNAQRIAEQDEQLFKNDAIARRDMEQAQTDAVAARADLAAAAQQLRSLGIDPDSAVDDSGGGPPSEGVIRAPLTGTLVERLITPGQLLEAGATPCFTIANLSKVWVMANVFTTDLGHVAVGDRADITTAASSASFPGTIDYVAALVDPTTKATAVRIVTANPGHLLRRDMYVNVTIHSSRSDRGLLIPVAAVLRDDDNQPFVFLDQGGGHYLRRDVVLGTRVDDRYPVAAGLQAGDRIVSEGGLFLQFAQGQ